MIDRVIVSKAALAELGTALVAAGRSEMLTDLGTVLCGDVEFCADAAPAPAVRAARYAQMIDDLADKPLTNVVFADGTSEISTRCRGDGIHVIEETNGAYREIVLPRDSVPLVSASLIDCMGQPAE